MTRPVAPAGNGLSVRVVDGIARLRLERTAPGNRITQSVAQALVDAAADIELDDRVSAVVLEASGKDFCTGVEAAGDWLDRIDWVDAIARLTRPVVGAIQGPAIAEGFELALACDLRVVSSRARFAMPQLAAGRLPSHGGTQRLPRIVGRTRALDLLLTGRTISAADAEEMGIATRLVPHDGFAQAVTDIVKTLRGKGPIALRYAKEAVLKGSDLTLEQGTRLEQDLYVLLQTTIDRQEGIVAFLSKRRPSFRGR